MKKIKIAHITTVDLSLRYLLLNQLRDLVEKGYEVVGISTDGASIPPVRAIGVRHIPVLMRRSAFSPMADLRSLWNLFRVLRREQFAIVHTHTPKAGLLGRWAAKLAGVPVIVHTSHGFIFHDGSPWLWRRFFILLESLAARCSDLIFSVNSEDVDTAIQEGICSPGQMIFVGGEGVDTKVYDRARFSPDDLERKRIELGIPNQALVVGFVGRLVQEKGILDLFAAARIVRERLPDVRFLIIGPVDQAKKDAVRPERAGDFGIADICIFAGMREDIAELYPLMDVFVLPSYREGFPRSPMEASAMGVPCIVTDIRGCREVVKHGRTGWLTPPGDIPALAQAIVDLLTHPAQAREMGQQGRQIALEQFDEDRVFEKVRLEYVRLLRTKGLVESIGRRTQGEP